MLAHRSARTALRSVRIARFTTSAVARDLQSGDKAIAPLNATQIDVGGPIEFQQPPYDPQLGDYPQLPAVSQQWRKPSDKWWDKQGRRNFGEPVHEQDEALTIWAPDVYPISGPSALFQFSLAMLGFTAFGLLLWRVKPERPAVPREYPYDGLASHLGGQLNKANTGEEVEE